MIFFQNQKKKYVLGVGHEDYDFFPSNQYFLHQGFLLLSIIFLLITSKQ